MQNIYNFFRKNSIGEPPWDYYFLKNLDEKEYPIYLAKLFYLNTGEKLPLEWSFKSGEWNINKKKCKTFNQKIQWIKLYGITDLMRKCTDKVAVRNYVAEKIGSEYLKPVLQVILENKADECGVFPNSFRELSDNEFNNKFANGKMLKQVQHDESPIDSQSGLINKNDITTYFDKIDCENLLNKKDTSASNGYLPQYDEIITDFNVLSHSEPDVNSGVKNLYNSRYDHVTTYFDQINFDKLPNSFVIKCNHGCKWQYIIKDKEAFLQNKRLFDIVKHQMTGWLEQDYSFWSGFEMQYATGQDGIEPKILIEPLLRENINKNSIEINVYCFNSSPTIFIKFFGNKMNIWDSQFRPMRNIFKFVEINEKSDCTSNIKQTFDLYIKEFKNLNKKLSENFLFVRIDWLVFKNKLYFEEMTFTPHSGYFRFLNDRINKDLGKLINIGE